MASETVGVEHKIHRGISDMVNGMMRVTEEISTHHFMVFPLCLKIFFISPMKYFLFTHPTEIRGFLVNLFNVSGRLHHAI